jgi:hypothetical protein
LAFFTRKRRSGIILIDTPSPIRHVTEPIKSGLEKSKRECLKLLSTVTEIPEVEIPLPIPIALIDHKFGKKKKKNSEYRQLEQTDIDSLKIPDIITLHQARAIANELGPRFVQSIILFREEWMLLTKSREKHKNYC